MQVRSGYLGQFGTRLLRFNDEVDADVKPNASPVVRFHDLHIDLQGKRMVYAHRLLTKSVAEGCKRRLRLQNKAVQAKKVVMQKASVWSVKLLCAVVLLTVFQSQVANAGWSGLINGLGVGWASVNVRSSAMKTELPEPRTT